MIIRPSEDPQLDYNDGFQLRTYYESLRGWLSNEYATWMPHHEQLAAVFAPRSPRFNYASQDLGWRKDLAIVDDTGVLALRTLTGGMMSGVCTPSRTWFHVRTDNEEVNATHEAKVWLEKVEDKLRTTMLRSNYYQSKHTMFRELGLYGTSCYLILEDEKDDIRCYPEPVGSYYISGDEALRVDFRMRIYSMTARQMVAKFGYKNCSSAVQSYWDSNAGGLKDQWLQVVHVIHPNTYFATNPKGEAAQYPWVSVYYELSQFNDSTGLLKRSGFYEKPFVAPRWDVTGEDFYGYSPAMDCLGDCMSLQLLQKRKSQAVDKMIDPPMIASPAMMNQKMSILPGDITFTDTRDGQMGFRPAYELNFNVQACLEDIREHQGRIDEGMFKTLFLMNADSDRRQITAEEIRAKQEEKMLILGPVLERLNDEALKPDIFRIFRILERRGKLPPMPEVMKKAKINIEFTSILSQAQKMLSINSIDRFEGFLGRQAAINPAVLDVVNSDEMNREYADLLGVPDKILNDQDTIGAIREDRAKQQALVQQADVAEKMASAGKTLSETPLTGDNALTRILQPNPGLG